MRLGGPGSFAQRRGLSGASAGGRAGVRPRESTRCHRHIMRRAAGRAFSRTQQRLGRVRAMKNLARPAKSECGMSERASERQPASQRDWEGMSHSLCVKQSTSLRAASAIPFEQFTGVAFCIRHLGACSFGDRARGIFCLRNGTRSSGRQVGQACFFEARTRRRRRPKVLLLLPPNVDFEPLRLPPLPPLLLAPNVAR